MAQQNTIFDNGLWKHEIRKVKDLVPNPKNPRTITESSLAGLRESLKKNGYTHRIIVDNKNMILSGHARWLVMQEDDPDGEIECLVATRDLTPEEEENAVLGHNVLGGEWNFQALQADFDPVKIQDFGIVLPEFQAIKPEFDVEELDKSHDSFFNIQIVFDSEREVDDFCAHYETDGAKGRLSIKWENLKPYLMDFNDADIQE